MPDSRNSALFDLALSDGHTVRLAIWFSKSPVLSARCDRCLAYAWYDPDTGYEIDAGEMDYASAEKRYGGPGDAVDDVIAFVRDDLGGDVTDVVPLADDVPAFVPDPVTVHDEPHGGPTFDAMDQEGNILAVGDSVTLFGIPGKIAVEWNAAGIVFDRDVDWDRIGTEIRLRTGNAPYACFNDAFISFWELIWNFDAGDTGMIPGLVKS